MFRHLILDYSGTLALDGRLLPGIAARLRELSNCLRITVLTADTFGKADRAVRGLPVEIRIIKVGREKADFIKRIILLRSLPLGTVATIGR